MYLQASFVFGIGSNLITDFRVSCNSNSTAGVSDKSLKNDEMHVMYGMYVCLLQVCDNDNVSVSYTVQPPPLANLEEITPYCVVIQYAMGAWRATNGGRLNWTG